VSSTDDGLADPTGPVSVSLKDSRNR
jgi:hypothetical protein